MKGSSSWETFYSFSCLKIHLTRFRIQGVSLSSTPWKSIWAASRPGHFASEGKVFYSHWNYGRPQNQLEFVARIFSATSGIKPHWSIWYPSHYIGWAISVLLLLICTINLFLAWSRNSARNFYLMSFAKFTHLLLLIKQTLCLCSVYRSTSLWKYYTGCPQSLVSNINAFILYGKENKIGTCCFLQIFS